MTMTGGPVTWQRLHPLTIVKEIGSMAWAIVAAIVFDFDSVPDIPGVPSGIDPDSVIAVGVFVFAVIRYLATAYRITDQTVELRGGVLVRRNQAMPRERIQSVSVVTPLIGRFIGVTTVEVSAADAEDIRLSYVSASHAEQLRRVLETTRRAASDAPGEGEPERRQLADIDARRLFVFALTEGWLAVAIVALVVGGIVSMVLGFFLPALLGAAALAGWPVARALGLIGFRSWLEGERLRLETGLLSRKESEVPLVRIQSVGIHRPLLRRGLGYETVEVVSGDPTVVKENAATSGIVAPLVPIGTWRSLVRELVGEVPFGEPDLRRSSPHTIRRTAVRGCLLTAIAAGLVALPAVWSLIPWWVAAVVAGVGVALSLAYGRARYRILGWLTNEDFLMVRRGVVGRRLQVVPIHKVQDVSVTATIFQRRLGIATVEVDTAGTTWSAVVAIDLPREEARRLADQLVDTARRVALPDGV